MNIYLCKKKSGAIVISKAESSAWQTIATCETPKELYFEVNKLPTASKIIKATYQRSQLTTLAKMYTKADAMKAFGLSASLTMIQKHFEQ